MDTVFYENFRKKLTIGDYIVAFYIIAIFVFGFVAFCITPVCYIKGKILLINRYVKS